jgi:hypothetical protein
MSRPKKYKAESVISNRTELSKRTRAEKLQIAKDAAAITQQILEKNTPPKLLKTMQSILANETHEEYLASMSWHRQREVDRLIVDPHRDEPLACMFSDHILSRENSNNATIGKFFHDVLSKLDSEKLELLFKRIVNLKKNAESRGRAAYAYYAYSSFIDETDREPSKMELKKYIIARREIYKESPSSDDAKGWTRLWKACGLFDLAER